MRKQHELENPNSCLNKALPHEMLFVLLGRDPDAPATVRYWTSLRARRERNQCHDSKVPEARECATIMESEWVKIREEVRSMRHLEAVNIVEELRNGLSKADLQKDGLSELVLKLQNAIDKLS